MFTVNEVAAIEHRLGAADALAEVFAEEFSEKEVCVAIREIENRLRFGFPVAPENLNPCEQAVLRDCVEGSTWVGVTLGQTSVSTERRAVKTLESVATKLEALGYEPLQVPNY